MGFSFHIFLYWAVHHQIIFFSEGVWESESACFSPPHWSQFDKFLSNSRYKIILWSLKVTAPSSSTGVADEKNDVNHLHFFCWLCVSVWVHLAFLLIHSTLKLHEIISTDYSLFIILGTWDLSNWNLFLPCWEMFFNYLFPPLHFHSSLKLLLRKHLPIWIGLCVFFQVIHLSIYSLFCKILKLCSVVCLNFFHSMHYNY